MKLAKLLSLVLVFIMLFSLLAVSASAILCEDQENTNQEGIVYAEKNGPTKSAKGYLAVGGEIRPEDDDPFDGARFETLKTIIDDSSESSSTTTDSSDK